MTPIGSKKDLNILKYLKWPDSIIITKLNSKAKIDTRHWNPFISDTRTRRTSRSVTRTIKLSACGRVERRAMKSLIELVIENQYLINHVLKLFRYIQIIADYYAKSEIRYCKSPAVVNACKEEMMGNIIRLLSYEKYNRIYSDIILIWSIYIYDPYKMTHLYNLYHSIVRTYHISVH